MNKYLCEECGKIVHISGPKDKIYHMTFVYSHTSRIYQLCKSCYDYNIMKWDEKVKKNIEKDNEKSGSSICIWEQMYDSTKWAPIAKKHINKETYYEYKDIEYGQKTTKSNANNDKLNIQKEIYSILSGKVGRIDDPYVEKALINIEEALTKIQDYINKE